MSKAFLKAFEEDNGRPHPSVTAKPQPRGDCIKYLDAFRLLGCSRIWDQVGPKPIPTTEIESFLNLHGIEDVDTRLKYLRLFRRMDLTELEIQHHKLSKQRPAK